MDSPELELGEFLFHALPSREKDCVQREARASIPFSFDNGCIFGIHEDGGQDVLPPLFIPKGFIPSKEGAVGVIHCVD